MNVQTLKRIEDVFDKLPEEKREEIVDFAEYLFNNYQKKVLKKTILRDIRTFDLGCDVIIDREEIYRERGM
ncbi:MAG: DUF2281 domain-containing protein [Nitrospirae bacterium]|nr:DUF2281 domain-containing protein [Nitrospirota bacterium]